LEQTDFKPSVGIIWKQYFDRSIKSFIIFCAVFDKIFKIFFQSRQAESKCDRIFLGTAPFLLRPKVLTVHRKPQSFSTRYSQPSKVRISSQKTGLNHTLL
jgi:hypothetical protein